MRVFEELARVEPREVIMPESWVERGVTLPEGIHLSAAQDWTSSSAALNSFCAIISASELWMATG